MMKKKKKKEGNRYITNSRRYKDVSHRRAWHIRMTTTSSLVLSEWEKKKNSPCEPSLPTLIKNPDDERDAERVWRRMWEPYPSCGVSDTNALGWKLYSGVLTQTWPTNAGGIKRSASLTRARPLPQDHRAWVASIKLPPARRRPCQGIVLSGRGVHGWNRHPRPGDFVISRYVRWARCQHKYTAEWREHRDAAEICRSGSLIIPRFFFPTFLLFIVYTGLNVLNPIMLSKRHEVSRFQMCIYQPHVLLLLLLSVNFPSNRSDLCQSRFLQTKRLMTLGYRELAAANQGLGKRSLVR